MNDRVCRDSDRLRNPDRLARLEIDRVAGLCLEGPAVRSVLDVGTGTGVFAEAFAARDLSVAGVDIQESMLEGARSHVPAARFLLAPSENLPFEDGEFDVVFLGLVLHETENADRTMAEAFRVCALRTAVLEWPLQEQPFGPPVAERLSESTVRTLGEKAGFSIIRAVPLTTLMLYLFDKQARFRLPARGLEE
jgi:ubiquinone/menaquinone biosynthesis C-methylase UbiE